jgi:hypothetical protein
MLTWFGWLKPFAAERILLCFALVVTPRLTRMTLNPQLLTDYFSVGSVHCLQTSQLALASAAFLL